MQESLPAIDMTNEQINRAVAEELGIKPHWYCRKCGEVEETRVTDMEFHDSEGCFAPARRVYRDFCTDHNAVAEMRKAIRPDEEVRFAQVLYDLTFQGHEDIMPEYYWTLINATPRQQSEAFLKMRGKWREE